MRYGVIGSRTFLDYDLLKSVLDKHIITQIISGGARGADTLGARYAHETDINLIEFFPDYVKYKKKAPFVRNKLIVDASDIIVAFWDEQSKGTAHSLDYARLKKKKSIVCNFDGHIHNY
jgi:predicted Rossmann fold nucleotide-binding protein DprA/Smf involved in DNA uptake